MALIGRHGLFGPLSRSDKSWDVLEQAPSTQFAKDVSDVANTRVDWVETPEAHIFKAELPVGLKEEEIKIQIEGRTLQISGERKEEEVQETDKGHRVERTEGSFLISFCLPENAKLDEVKAKVENGVLTINVPKEEKPKPKPGIKSIDISG